MTPPLQKAFTPDPEFKARLARAKGTPILDVWRRLGQPDPPASGVISSPFREDRNPSFQVGGTRNICFDHATSQTWDPIDLAQAMLGCSLGDGISFVLGESPVDSFPQRIAPVAQPATAEPAKKERAGSGAGKLWHSEAEALSALDGMTLVADDPAAVEWFTTSYGVAGVPEGWRLFSHPKLGAGVAYPGFDLSGRLVSVKWRGFQRDGHGKRACRFLYGHSGFTMLQSDGDCPDWILTNGEEKVCAAWNAGYSAFGILTGERSPGPEAAKWLAENVRGRVCVANDADPAGQRANAETVRDLLAAGFPVDRLFVLDFGPDRPVGYDLNDLVKAPENWDKPLWSFAVPAELEGGLTATASEEAGPVEVASPEQPGAMLPLRSFLTVERPPLEWHIQGLLPRQGKMVLTGASKSGKTFLGLELALSLAAGQDFTIFQIPKPVRVAYLQPELSDSLLAARLKWILETADPDFDSETALDNLLVYQCDAGRPTIATPEGQARIQAVLDDHKPDVVFADPLYMLRPGLVENAAEEMTLALDHIAGWTSSGASVCLIHHFNKSGTSRGSSVLSGWPESDLTMTVTDSREHVKIDGSFRCIYGDEFPRYLKRPDSDSAWFEAMPVGWEPPAKSTGTESPKNQHTETIVSILRDAGRGMGFNELRRTLVEKGVPDSTAKRAITRAVSGGAVSHAGSIYYV